MDNPAVATKETAGIGARLPTLADKFQIASCTEEGGGWQRYLLRDALSGVMYVLKAAPEAELPAFQREYELFVRLHDDAFPHPTAVYKSQGRAFFIREYIPGKTLENLRLEGPLGQASALALSAEACAIVAKLHAMTPPVVHPGIEPRNFVLGEDGRLHLVDLGGARSLDGKGPSASAPAAAPELSAMPCHDERTDVFALGGMLLFLLTGSRDLQALDRARVSPSVRRLVAHCLEFDPSRRPESVKKVIAQIEALRSRRRRWVRALTGVAAAVLLAAFFIGNSDTLARYVGCAILVAGAEEYRFSSPLVERAVRLQLDRPYGRISRQDMLTVTELYLCAETPYKNWSDLQSNGGGEQQLNGVSHSEYARLDDLSDLENMPALTSLALNRLSIRDLAPLAGLKLVRLGLGSNSISDLTPILGMDTLEALDISDNPLYDLRGLERLTNLNSLNITAVPAASLEPLASLRLFALSYFDMLPVTDASALGRMEELQFFGTRYLTREGIEALSRAKAMRRAYVFYSEADSLKPFLGMRALTCLTLRGAKLKDLEGISALPVLEEADFSECGLEHIDALRSNSTVRLINLAYNPLTDLSALMEMSALNHVTLSTDQRSLADALPPDRKFSITFI